MTPLDAFRQWNLDSFTHRTIGDVHYAEQPQGAHPSASQSCYWTDDGRSVTVHRPSDAPLAIVRDLGPTPDGEMGSTAICVHHEGNVGDDTIETCALGWFDLGHFCAEQDGSASRFEAIVDGDEIVMLEVDN